MVFTYMADVIFKGFALLLRVWSIAQCEALTESSQCLHNISTKHKVATFTDKSSKT